MLRRLRDWDADVATAVNAAARRVRWGPPVTAVAARGLAPVEVALMLGLAARGRPATAIRMLAAVATVYVASEQAGVLFTRQRPFERDPTIQPLLPHTRGRSFPSRHVASAVAMASLAAPVDRRVAGLMSLAAVLLGISRVSVGLHYPSDVLAGVALGRLVGRLLQPR